MGGVPGSDQVMQGRCIGAGLELLAQGAVAEKLGDFGEDFQVFLGRSLWHQQRTFEFFRAQLPALAFPSFSLVVRLRPDLFFHRLEIHEPSPADVCVPYWGGYGGINDRFAFMGADAARYYFNTYDGAGEVGSGIAALKMLNINLNSESENEKGYRKNIVIGNTKGSEIQTGKDIGNIKNELKLLVGNRFFLEISATGADMESIKTGIKKAKLIEKLEALK